MNIFKKVQFAIFILSLRPRLFLFLLSFHFSLFCVNNYELDFNE